MPRKSFQLILTMTVLSLFGLSTSGKQVLAGVKDTGEKGAQIYCYMRNTGNNHEVSWNAAYAVIKRQTNSLFKTSPKHGAVMIIESVVNNPEEYESCGNYLGDLFSSKNEEDSNLDEGAVTNEEKNNRYSY